jgi:SCY1-like protein 1
MDLMLRAAPGAMDVWALGVLLGEIVQLTEGKALTSGPLATIQRRCLNDNPPDRPSAAKILQHPLLKPPPGPEQGKELLYVLPFLETFSLQDDAAKVQFFQHLAAGPAPLLAALPPEVGLHKILPTFRDYVHIGPPSAAGGGGGSAAGGGAPPASADALLQQPGRRQLVLAALPACLAILKGMGPEVFAQDGEPLVVSLFGLQDRALRATLLQGLGGLADKLSTDAVNGRLLESILGGFNDSAPQLRELTLKSMLCLSPRLTERNLTDRLMQRLAKLQADPEPSIRTNTTIFLGRVAPQLKDGARTRLLLPAFLKACRDPFPHARLAGLKAAAACSAYFDPPSVATKLLPTVCCLLVRACVRGHSIRCMGTE